MSGTLGYERIWKTDVYYAPLGTTAPTTPTATLATGWVPVGFVSDDSINPDNPREVSDHYDLNGVLYRTGVNNEKHSMKFFMLENTARTQALTNPGGTIVVTSGVATVSSYNFRSNPLMWILDKTDGSIREREIYSRGEIVEAIDIASINAKDPAKFGVTVNFYGDPWRTIVSTDPGLLGT